MEHERALQEKAKQIEEEYIAIIDPETQQVVGEDGELLEENEEQQEGDKLTSISQVQPTASQISKMTGRTYISELQKQLEDERDARQKLEKDLNQLKIVSEEITSQLSKVAKNV